MELHVEIFSCVQFIPCTGLGYEALTGSELAFPYFGIAGVGHLGCTLEVPHMSVIPQSYNSLSNSLINIL